MSEHNDSDVDSRRERRRARRRNRRSGRDNQPWANLVWGLTLLAAGTVFWLDQLGKIDAADYAQWWPLALIAMGLAHLPHRHWIPAAIYIAIGSALLPQIPMFPHFELSRLLGVWPLLISAAGITLVFQALHPTAKDLPNTSSFHAFAWMGGSGRAVTSQNFAGGDATVVMGALEINLSRAELTGEAVIDVMAFWGGIDLRVPKHWTVESHVVALLGGYSDHTISPGSEGGPRLIVRGSAIMGGIEIKNPKEAHA